MSKLHGTTPETAKTHTARSQTAKTHKKNNPPQSAGAKGQVASACTASHGEPTFTPERLARSVFGRAYWGQRQHDDLSQLSAQSDARMAAQRKDWKAAHRERMALLEKEQRRKARIARSGRRDQGTE